MATTAANTTFVWIWLPGATEPVVAGRLDRDGVITTFTYGASYRRRSDAIALYLPELPLSSTTHAPEFLAIPSCIADAGPDAWGRRVVEARLGATATGSADLSELDYLMASGSDRIGALDFQASPSEYEARATTQHRSLSSCERPSWSGRASPSPPTSIARSGTAPPSAAPARRRTCAMEIDR